MQLRFATADDVAGIHEVYAPVVEQTAISFEMVPPTHDELARRIADTMPQYPWLVAADATLEREPILGYAYGHRFAERAAYGWSVETSIYVRETARGQRIGTTLYETLLTLLASQGYQQAFAGIALPNPASVRLHESIGFEHVGTYRDVGYKFDAWHDVGWWQRRLADHGTAAIPPLTVDVLEPALLDRVLGTR